MSEGPMHVRSESQGRAGNCSLGSGLVREGLRVEWRVKGAGIQTGGAQESEGGHGGGSLRGLEV